MAMTVVQCWIDGREKGMKNMSKSADIGFLTYFLIIIKVKATAVQQSITNNFELKWKSTPKCKKEWAAKISVLSVANKCECMRLNDTQK